MANNLTTQNAVLATIPTSSEIETYDTGDGHRQVVTIGASGAKTVAAATCDTTADQLVAANADRKSVMIQNVGTIDIYLGLSGVTTSTGILLAAGAVLEDDKSVDAWYGITASGTGAVRYCEVT